MASGPQWTSWRRSTHWRTAVRAAPRPIACLCVTRIRSSPLRDRPSAGVSSRRAVPRLDAGLRHGRPGSYAACVSYVCFGLTCLWFAALGAVCVGQVEFVQAMVRLAATGDSGAAAQLAAVALKNAFQVPTHPFLGCCCAARAVVGPCSRRPCHAVDPKTRARTATGNAARLGLDRWPLPGGAEENGNPWCQLSCLLSLSHFTPRSSAGATHAINRCWVCSGARTRRCGP